MKAIGSFVALAIRAAQHEQTTGSGRELPDRQWTGTQIFTNDSNTTYFTPPGPAPGCSVAFEDPYIFGAEITEFHQFWANCSAGDGSVEADSVDVWGLPNGDFYYERRNGDRSLPCDIGNFSALNARQAVGARWVQAEEICTGAPTAPTRPTSSPTFQPSATPTVESPSRAHDAAGMSSETLAGIAAGSVAGFVLGALVGTLCVIKLRNRHIQQQPAVAPRRPYVELGPPPAYQELDVSPPPGSAPPAVVIHAPFQQLAGSPPRYSL